MWEVPIVHVEKRPSKQITSWTFNFGSKILKILKVPIFLAKIFIFGGLWVNTLECASTDKVLKMGKRDSAQGGTITDSLGTCNYVHITHLEPITLTHSLLTLLWTLEADTPTSIYRKSNYSGCYVQSKLCPGLSLVLSM